MGAVQPFFIIAIVGCLLSFLFMNIVFFAAKRDHIKNNRKSIRTIFLSSVGCLVIAFVSTSFIAWDLGLKYTM